MSIPPESLKPGDADAHKPLVIPVILGTARQGRRSEHIARFVAGRLADFPGVETTIVDIRELKLSMKDAGENIKDPEFSSLCTRTRSSSWLPSTTTDIRDFSSTRSTRT